MSKVVAIMSMSLDGYVADLNGGVAEVFDWYFNSGDVEIQDVGASVKAQSGSGSVRVHGVQGMTTLGTGSGDIELQQTGPGDVKAETGSGSIRLHGISGALKASTGSGDIEAEGQPTSDWKVSTGSGSVRLSVGNAHFTLDADTGSEDAQRWAESFLATDPGDAENQAHDTIDRDDD